MDSNNSNKTVKTRLKTETEAFITAAQDDQAIDTTCHKAKIFHTTNDPKCKMCEEEDETLRQLPA